MTTKDDHATVAPGGCALLLWLAAASGTIALIVAAIAASLAEIGSLSQIHASLLAASISGPASWILLRLDAQRPDPEDSASAA